MFVGQFDVDEDGTAVRQIDDGRESVCRSCVDDVRMTYYEQSSPGTGILASAGVSRCDVNRSSSSSKLSQRRWWRRSMF